MQLQPGSIGHANKSSASFVVFLAPCLFSLGICCDAPYSFPLKAVLLYQETNILFYVLCGNGKECVCDFWVRF